MRSLIKKLFFKDARIRTFSIARLSAYDIKEQVFLQKEGLSIDVSTKHGMICLEPFCIAVWLSPEQLNTFDPQQATLRFKRGNDTIAAINVSLIEKIVEGNCVLLLYKIISSKNFQLTALKRLILFSYLLRNKTSTYQYRKTLSALYSYPRKIIVVSYKDENYCNIFPMDIQGYVKEGGMYVLGLRTTNKTLDKILNAKKVVVCDIDSVDINTIYTLGKHPSASPPKLEEMPFGTTGSEVFNFPIPDFAECYKEIEIIAHRKMGYHMLMVGKIVNSKVIKQDSSSLYHVSFLEQLMENYKTIDGVY